MSFGQILMDFVRGFLLGLCAVTPFIITVFVFEYVQKILGKTEGVKTYMQFLALVPVLIVWALAFMSSVYEKIQEMSFIGYIPCFAVCILGGASAFAAAAQWETTEEKELKKLRSENKYLNNRVESLEFSRDYYERLYKNDHPDES